MILASCWFSLTVIVVRLLSSYGWYRVARGLEFLANIFFEDLKPCMVDLQTSWVFAHIAQTSDCTGRFSICLICPNVHSPLSFLSCGSYRSCSSGCQLLLPQVPYFGIVGYFLVPSAIYPAIAILFLDVIQCFLEITGQARSDSLLKYIDCSVSYVYISCAYLYTDWVAQSQQQRQKTTTSLKCRYLSIVFSVFSWLHMQFFFLKNT